VALADRAAKSGVEWQAQRFHRFGAIVHKIDFKALGKPLWAGYYGADHAGTDAFKDCDVLLVRRLVPPYSEIALQAAALRRVLGLPPIDKPGKTTREVRAWPGFAQITCVLEDEFENELLRYHERHSQLNAIGRCRPLSRAPSPTLVVLLAGRPFDGIAPTCKPIGRVLAELGIKIVLPKQIDRDAALEAYNERQAVEVVDRHDRLLGLLRQHGPLSLRRLCTELRVSTSTVRRDLAELQAEGAIGPAAEDRSVTIAIPRSKRDAAELEWPTPERVTGLLTRVGSKVPSANTLRSCLRRVKSIVDRATGPGPVPVPARRSDQAAHLQAVAEAVAQILNAQIDQARAPASDLDLPVALQLFSTTSDSEAWRLLPPIAVRNDRDADVSSVGLFEAGGGQLSEYRRLTDVRLVAATDALRASGLLFFGEATYGELRFSFTVRRTRQGRLALAFPTRHDVRGGKHAIVRPVNDAARVAIEAQVFAAMHLEQDAAP
jgi:predicted transcriptional regulator